jgi:hypothetical protein
MGVPKRSSPQKAAYWYRLLTALRSRKKHICYRQICESTEQGPEQSKGMFVRIIFFRVKKIKCFVYEVLYCHCRVRSAF